MNRVEFIDFTVCRYSLGVSVPNVNVIGVCDHFVERDKRLSW
jgi:hypothetical protein